MTLPNIWPVFNIINIITLPDADPDAKKNKKKKEETKAFHDEKYSYFSELFARNVRLSTYWFVAYVVMLYAFPSYEDLTNTDIDLKSFMMKWTAIVLIRDFIIVGFFYYMWHWFLFQSPWAPKLKRLKYNQEYPPQSQWDRSRFWSFCTTIIISMNELGVIYIIKTNPWLLYKTFWGSINHSLYGIFWLYITPYILDAHFYIFHRMQHKWNWKLFGLFDPGYYLYKYAHKHHHVDVNVGPWSALSVHPIEAILDVNGIFIPIIFKYFAIHPIHILFNKFYNILSPLPNHDGFDEPGGASYFHFLHHAHFECNYGSPLVPFDTWFGSFEDGKKYQKKQ